MDWAKILKFAKAKGYTGADDAAGEVSTFLASKNLILAADDGTDLDLTAIQKAHAEANKPRRVTLVDAEETRTAELEDENAKLKARAKGAASVHGATVGGNDEPQRFSIGNTARKAYESKIKNAGVGKGQNQAKFSDVDTAEMCAASIRLAMCGTKGYAQKANDLDILKKGQVAFDNTLGGYLVPEEFVAQLIYATEPYGVARKVANVRRMTENLQRLPRKTGIPTMGWVGEAQSTTAQNATFDQVEMAARELQLLMSASNTLLSDSAINISDEIATTVREAYDIAIDSAYFIGDGTATYGGFTGLKTALPASAYITATGAWSAYVTADFHKALGSLENINSSRIAMVMSRQAYFQICQRLDKATSQFKDLIMGTGADAAFLGYPVYFSQVLPTATASSAKSIYIGDFVGGSMIGERQDLTGASSEHSLFSTNSMQWRANARASVNIHGDGRGSTYGPIVCLVNT